MTTLPSRLKPSREPSADPLGGSAPRTHSRVVDATRWRLLALFGFTAVMWIVFDYLTDGVYLTPRNISNLTVQASITALVALGTNWVLLVREIDLSSGSLLSVVGVITVALQADHGWSVPTAVALALIIGVVAGTVNGAIIVGLRVPSFIMTLGAMMYLRGLAFIISAGFVVSGASDSFFNIANSELSTALTSALGALIAAIVAIYCLRSMRVRRPAEQAGPAWQAPRAINVASGAVLLIVGGVLLWAYTSYNGFPTPVAIVAVVALVMWFVGKYTRFGRHMYAVGGNPEAARRAGIAVGRTILIVFAIAGFLAAAAGVLQASRLNAGPPDIGSLITLNAISAVVIGGTSLFGGRGTVAGALLGTVVLASILNGLSLLAVNTFYQFVVIGWIMVLAVAIDSAAQRRAIRA